MKLDLNNKTSTYIFNALKAIVILTMAFLCIISFKNNNEKLHIDSENKKTIIKEFNNKNGDSFFIEFIHSVNNSPVREFYKIGDYNKIILYKSEYFNFGAGVETNIYGDQKFVFGPNGSLAFYDLNIEFDELNYIVGTVSDHTLCVIDKNNNVLKSYVLNEIFGKNSKINIYFK